MNIIIKKYLLLNHYYNLYNIIYDIYDYDDKILYNGFIYNILSHILYYTINYDHLLIDIKNIRCINLHLDMMEIRFKLSDNLNMLIDIDFNKLDSNYTIEIKYVIVS